MKDIITMRKIKLRSNLTFVLPIFLALHYKMYPTVGLISFALFGSILYHTHHDFFSFLFSFHGGSGKS